MQSTKKKSWSLTIGKVKKYVLILGVILACTAPFLHMLLPKTNTQIIELRTKFDNGLISEDFYAQQSDILIADARLFGFPNARKFWFVIGKPLLLLFASFYLIFLGPLIPNKTLKETTHIFSVLLCFIAMYFIVWTFWYRGDFPKYLYYIAIGITSVLGTIFSVFTIRYRFELKRKIYPAGARVSATASLQLVAYRVSTRVRN